MTDEERNRLIAADTLEKVKSHLERITNEYEISLKSLFKINLTAPFEDDASIQSLLTQTVSAANSLSMLTDFTKFTCMELQINLVLGNLCFGNPQHDNAIGDKKKLVSQLNEYMRSNGFALRDTHSFSGDESPKILVITTSRDGKGRYSFEDRETKKRTGSYAGIEELIPLRFTKDLIRKAPTKKPDSEQYDGMS